MSETVSGINLNTVVPRYKIIFTTETSTSDGISLGTDLFLSKFTIL